MSARSRALRFALVPILVLSAEAGVIAQRSAPPPQTPKSTSEPSQTPKSSPPHTSKSEPAPPHTSKPAPPPSQAAKPAPPRAKAPSTPPQPTTTLKTALERIQQRVAATVGPAATPQVAPHFPGLAKGPTSRTTAAGTPPPAGAASAAEAPASSAPSPPATAAAPVKPAMMVRHPTAPAPRIQLSWRTTLAWPSTLVDKADPATAAGSPRRITLIWR